MPGFPERGGLPLAIQYHHAFHQGASPNVVTRAVIDNSGEVCYVAKGMLPRPARAGGGWGNRERVPGGWVVTIPLWGQSSPNLSHQVGL